MIAPVANPPDLKEMRAELGFNTDVMGLILDTSSRTLERWEKKASLEAIPPSVYGRLVKLHELLALGRTVYGPEGFRRFLRTPLPAFGGKAAYQLLLIGELELVLAQLAADYEGSGM